MSLLSLIKNALTPAQSGNDVAAQLAKLESKADSNPHRAAKYHARAARLAAQQGLQEREAHNQYRLGLLLRTSGATRKAELALARAANVWEALDNSRAAGDAHLARAGVCLMDRRVGAAQEFADKAKDEFARANVLAERPQLTRLLSAIAAMRAASTG